jgi:response regulator RpfG family c-di-GMP phosphodiesterase
MVPSVAPPAFRPWVLLLVDDEPDILASMKTLLESSITSLKVITAPSGRIGLELLERERVDLIVSDFKMPGMDGIEFLYQCRRHHPMIPRVMLTAFGNEELARRAVVDAFVGSFLSKGADPETLVEGVSHLLDYHPSSTPPPPLPNPVPKGSLFPAGGATPL